MGQPSGALHPNTVCYPCYRIIVDVHGFGMVSHGKRPARFLKIEMVGPQGPSGEADMTEDKL